jgi:hypothetical protein
MFLILGFFISGCGVKSKPNAYPEKAIPSYTKLFLSEEPVEPIKPLNPVK